MERVNPLHTGNYYDNIHTVIHRSLTITSTLPENLKQILQNL